MSAALTAAALQHLVEPGAVFEIRIPEPATGYGSLAGYFDDPAAAAKAAAAWSGKCAAVYITPNPVKPALLARANNRLKRLGKKDSTTSDADILSRCWLLIDLDPVRPAGISSSESEHAAALVKAEQIRDWLTAQGWPAPILADSGNGGHLLYRIDLPNDDDAKALVKNCLEALAGKFDDRNGQACPVKVDTCVFNASRIWKLYGTLAGKGDSLPERPHRLARILEAPEALAVVLPDQLQALASLAPQPEPKAPPAPGPAPAGSGFFAEVNARAMATLSGWVPALLPDARPYRDGYRVTSKNLRRDLEEDLSIQPDGIVDFGVADMGDAKGGRRTPIDLVIEVRGGDAKAGALWLCSTLGIAPESLGWKASQGKQEGRARPDGTGTPQDWPDPVPLPVGMPPVEPFDMAMLPEALTPWILDISERLQCPPEYPAVGALVTMAAVVGRKVGIRPKQQDDWLVVPNLWGVIIGRPGVLKSPALQESLKPIMRLEVNAKNQHTAAKADADADADADQAVSAARRKVNEQKIREAIKRGIGDPYEIARLSAAAEDSAPTRRRYLVNDSSVEKLGELLNENPNGLLAFRDELLGLLHALEREGQECSRQFYLECWNGTGRFTYDRIGRGTVDIEACCLSLLGSIQPGPLQDYLATAPDDGLMQRFQLAVWPDMDPGWQDVDRWPDKSARDRAWSVFSRLDSLAPLAIGATPPDDGEIPWLRFNPEAQAEFAIWRATLEKRLRTEDMHPALETCLAKHRSLIPTLALLIHLADTPEGGPVALTALLKACAWGEFLESHARRIYAAQTNAAMLGAVRLA